MLWIFVIFIAWECILKLQNYTHKNGVANKTLQANIWKQQHHSIFLWRVYKNSTWFLLRNSYSFDLGKNVFSMGISLNKTNNELFLWQCCELFIEFHHIYSLVMEINGNDVAFKLALEWPNSFCIEQKVSNWLLF